MRTVATSAVLAAVQFNVKQEPRETYVHRATLAIMKVLS
jgi:hypothetical protein